MCATVDNGGSCGGLVTYRAGPPTRRQLRLRAGSQFHERCTPRLQSWTAGGAGPHGRIGPAPGTEHAALGRPGGRMAPARRERPPPLPRRRRALGRSAEPQASPWFRQATRHSGVRLGSRAAVVDPGLPSPAGPPGWQPDRPLWGLGAQHSPIFAKAACPGVAASRCLHASIVRGPWRSPGVLALRQPDSQHPAILLTDEDGTMRGRLPAWQAEERARRNCGRV